MDEVKAAWHELEERMEARLATDRELLAEMKLDRARSRLRGLPLLLWAEVIVDGIGALLAASYLAENLTAARFAVPAATLQLAAVLGAVTTGWQLTALGRIDRSGPVARVQRRLAELRVYRARQTLWTLALAPLLWTPLVIVGAHALAGVDLYREAPAWLVANLGFGLAVVLLAVWAARRYGDRIRRSRLGRALADGIVDRRLGAAAADLEEIERFGTEG